MRKKGTYKPTPRLVVWWFGFVWATNPDVVLFVSLGPLILALASTLGMLALLANRYEIFTRPQDGLVCNCQIVISQETQSQFTKDLQSRLRRQQWEQLQEIITWVRPTIDEIHAVPWSAHHD